jgi:hypothetical protein
MIRDDEFRQTAQRVIRNDPSRPIKRAYDYVLREQRRNEQRSGVQRQPIREFVNIRSSLSRAKSSLVPNLPDDIHSVVIASPWSETWSSDRFLLHIDPNLGIAIFCTDENLKILRKCKEIYIDGTFRSCPKPYKQYVRYCTWQVSWKSTLPCLNLAHRQNQSPIPSFVAYVEDISPSCNPSQVSSCKGDVRF